MKTSVLGVLAMLIGASFSVGAAAPDDGSGPEATTAPSVVLRRPLFAPAVNLFGEASGAAALASQSSGTPPINFFSTGVTNLSFGAEGSAGGELSGGSLPYAGILSVGSANALQFGSASVVRMTVASGGNVGIGTASPAQKLSVAGAIESTSGGFKFPDGSVQTTASGSGLWTPSGANINFASGNVGIGVASPGQRLSVAGAIESTSGGFKFPDGTVQTTATAVVSSPWTTAGANLGYVGGNVGIGIANPAAKLDVSGTIQGLTTFQSSTGNDLRLNANGVNRDVFVQVNGATLLDIQGSTGKVGIGTVSPNYKLHVEGGDAAVNNSVAGGATSFVIGNSFWAAGSLSGSAQLIFGLGPSSGGIISSEKEADYSTGGNRSAGLEFLTNNGNATTEKMRISAAGNVGIGTTSPTAKLHVAGDIVANGNIAAHYQDVAEWVDAVEPLEAGTIVAIDPSGSDRVIASEKAYDVRVAGAVSAQPGLILGDRGAGRVMVAQSGRVRVKVDATYGAIRAGDLLVTSPTPGHAMRSKPIKMSGTSMHRPGTVLGKALESLASGRGEILVLLTLQ